MSQDTNETLAMRFAAMEQAKAHLRTVLFLIYDKDKNEAANNLCADFVRQLEELI